MSHHLLAHVASWACHRWAVATGFWLLGVLKVQRSKQKFEQREPLEFEVLTLDHLSVWHILLWTIKSAKRFPNNADKHFQQHLGAPPSQNPICSGSKKASTCASSGMTHFSLLSLLLLWLLLLLPLLLFVVITLMTVCCGIYDYYQYYHHHHHFHCYCYGNDHSQHCHHLGTTIMQGCST